MPRGRFCGRPVDDHVWRFDFHIDNGVNEYVLGMPPLTEASADMTLTPHTFALDLRHAKVLNGEITSGHVAIPQLGQMGSTIKITAQGHGEVGEILRVIDSPPLKVLAKYGLKPEQGAGHADFDLAMTIPQQSNIPEQQLTYRVSAKGSDVKLIGLLPNVTIDHGTLDVDVTQAGLSSTGKFALDGAPMDVVWHEKFHDHSGLSTDFAVKTTLDDEARAGHRLRYRHLCDRPGCDRREDGGDGMKLRELAGKLDFTPSAVDLGEYSWSKRAGVAATAAFNIAISEAGAITVKSASASGKGIAIDGKAELAKDGKLVSANFPHLKLEGVADASASVSRANGNGLSVRVNGAFLNIAPILKQALDDGGGIGKVRVAHRCQSRFRRAARRRGGQEFQSHAGVERPGIERRRRARAIRQSGRFLGEFDRGRGQSAFAHHCLERCRAIRKGHDRHGQHTGRPPRPARKSCRARRRRRPMPSEHRPRRPVSSLPGTSARD